MDTPYRLKSTLQDLAQNDFGQYRAILGVVFTGPAHRVARGKIKDFGR